MNEVFNRYIQGLKNLRTYLKDSAKDQQILGNAELLQARMERAISAVQQYGKNPSDIGIDEILDLIIRFCLDHTDKSFIDEWCAGDHSIQVPLTSPQTKSSEPAPDATLPVRSNETLSQNSSINDKLRTLCESFEQSLLRAEAARKHLARQKQFTTTQGERAVLFLPDLDDPTRDLCDLLKQTSLPSVIETQPHRLILILQELEKEKISLKEYIEEGNKQKEAITSIENIEEQLKRISNTLREAFDGTVPLDQETSQPQVEQAMTATLSDFPPEARM